MNRPALSLSGAIAFPALVSHPVAAKAVWLHTELAARRRARSLQRAHTTVLFRAL